MAQADPQASSANLQPRRSTHQPKPVTSHPHFIYTDFQRHLAHLADDGNLLESPSVCADTQGPFSLKEAKKKTKCSSPKPRPKIPGSCFTYADLQGQLYDLHLPDQDLPDQVHVAFLSCKKAVLSPSTSNDPKSHSTLPAFPNHDLNQEIHLAQLQKEKLALELEVLPSSFLPRPQCFS